MSYTKQYGSAIILALFVTALVAGASAILYAHLQKDIRQTDLLMQSTSAAFYAAGGLAWSMDQLNEHWQQRQPNQLIDKFPLQSSIDTVNGFTIMTEIEDCQGKFNLNNVSDTSYRENFIKLLKITVAGISDKTAKEITSALIDWITPHRFLVSISELRMIKGMSATIFQQLSPYITALPIVTPLNVNTSSDKIFSSLSPTLSLESGQAIVNFRKNSPFINKDSFLKFDTVKNNAIPEAKITVESNYFLVKTTVTVSHRSLYFYTLLQRSEKSGKPLETILWQSKGTL